MWSVNPHSSLLLLFQLQNTCNNTCMSSGYKAIRWHIGKENAFLLWWKWEISTLILYLRVLLLCCLLSGFKASAAIWVHHTLQEILCGFGGLCGQYPFQNLSVKVERRSPDQNGGDNLCFEAGQCPSSWTASGKWLGRERLGVERGRPSSQKWAHQ